MIYDETIKSISQILELHGFTVVETLKNYTRYQSNRASISIAFNDGENSFVVFVGRNGKDLTELWQKVYKEFFDVDFQTIEGFSFSEKFINFLNGRGNFILKGDLDKLNDLEKYSTESAKAYTQSLINQQNLRIADEAWGENDYAKFITSINLVSADFLPKSYVLKCKIALRRLNE